MGRLFLRHIRNAETTRVHRLCGNDQFGGKDITPIEFSGERPQAFSDTDLMKERVCLIKMESDAMIQVTPVVIASPEIEEVHGSVLIPNAFTVQP